MKKIQLLVAGLFLIAGLSYAQTKQENINELLKLMSSEEMIDKMFENMLPLLAQQVGEDNEKHEEFMKYVMDEAKALAKQLIDVEMVGIYDKHFTDDEIKAFIQFYKTDAGKKMIEKTPEIQMDLMNSMMDKYMPEFQNKIMQKAGEMNN